MKDVEGSGEAEVKEVDDQPMEKRMENNGKKGVNVKEERVVSVEKSGEVKTENKVNGWI